MRAAVRWLLRAKEEGRDRCKQCQSKRPRRHPCSLHGEPPKAFRRMAFYVRLWNRVKRYRALPEPGGLLDQDEETMRALDLIGEEVDAFHELNRKMDDMRRAMAASPEARSAMRGRG